MTSQGEIKTIKLCYRYLRTGVCVAKTLGLIGALRDFSLGIGWGSLSSVDDADPGLLEIRCFRGPSKVSVTRK